MYESSGGGMAAVIMGVIALVLCVICIVSEWKIFEKAGEPGWASIAPLYNLYVMAKITMGNGLFFLLVFVPIAQMIIVLIMGWKLIKAFGGGFGMFLLYLFLPFIALPIIAFGDAQYLGPQ